MDYLLVGLTVVGVLLCGVTLLTSLASLWKRQSAEVELVEHISTRVPRSLRKESIDSFGYEKFRRAVTESLPNLSSGDRERLMKPLSQKSDEGRAAYLRKIYDRVAEKLLALNGELSGSESDPDSGNSGQISRDTVCPTPDSSSTILLFLDAHRENFTFLGEQSGVVDNVDIDNRLKTKLSRWRSRKRAELGLVHYLHSMHNPELMNYHSFQSKGVSKNYPTGYSGTTRVEQAERTLASEGRSRTNAAHSQF